MVVLIIDYGSGNIKSVYNSVKETLKSFDKFTEVRVSNDLIDIIKADIEGAERDMLDELIDLSKKFRTQFAICIYHSNLNNFELSDTVEIPLFLIDKLIDYNFYVGHYCYERWELVFYCIPKEKDNAPR